MTIVKNPLLGSLQTLIGISPAPVPLVLDESNISLVLPIVPDIARRSQQIGPLGGWFQGVLENVHSGADGEASNMDPYNPGASAVGAYPPVIPDGYDVWLMAVGGERSSGSGGLTGALMSMNPAPAAQGWGQDDQAAPVIATPRFYVARFDALSETVTVVANDPMITEAGETFVHVGLRIPRGGFIGFHSESAAAAEFQAIFIMGLFPAGLGQDVLT